MKGQITVFVHMLSRYCAKQCEIMDNVTYGLGLETCAGLWFNAFFASSIGIIQNLCSHSLQNKQLCNVVYLFNQWTGIICTVIASLESVDKLFLVQNEENSVLETVKLWVHSYSYGSVPALH